MAVTVLGKLGEGSASSAGTTLAVVNTTGAIIPAGTTMVLAYTCDNIASTTAPTLTASTSGGATWLADGAAIGSGVTTSAGAGIWHTTWDCITTADIASGATITTITSNQSAVKRVAAIIGIAGSTGARYGAVGYYSATSTAGTPSLNTSMTPPAGHVVVCTVGGENNAIPTGDSDTLNGSWSPIVGIATSGGGAAANVCVGLQAKVITAVGAQTYNPVTAGDSVAKSNNFVPKPDPAITQAAYGFYADGTETGSTALAGVSTAPTIDVTAGDVNVQLRARLQLTSAVAIDPTDDFQLQYEKNASGTWKDVVSSVAFDSYTGSGTFLRMGSGSGITIEAAQSLTGTGAPLDRATFWMRKIGAPTFNLTARLYAHTGTFGTNGMATGSPLATSTVRAASSLDTTAKWESFTFDGSFVPVNGTKYVLSIGCSAHQDPSNCVETLYNNSAPAHAGNWCDRTQLAGAWGVGGTADVIFSAESVGSTVMPYDSPNLTDAAATTNRLGAGTGSFVAGKVSEDGLVDDLGWTGSNYTELLYSIQLKQADLTNSDTLRFRVLRNGVTTFMTYSSVPTINVTKTVPAVTQAGYQFFDQGGETGFTIVDSYSDTNYTGAVSPPTSAGSGVGQSFIGTGKKLARAGFYMRRVGAPTGTLTAYLYAHTGTFGTSSAGTGTPLATSTTTIAASAVLTGTPTWYYFSFDGTYTLENGTAYVIAARNDAATSGSNTVSFGYNGTTPTHAGNEILYSGAGSWTPQAYDLIFSVESAVAALGAENTPITGNLTTGDGIGSLRVLLQSTNAAPIPATDDWQLQWEKNSSGSWTNIAFLLVSTAPQVGSGGFSLGSSSTSYVRVGQSFLGNGMPLVKAGFYIGRVGTPAGTLTAKLYVHTGTYGGSSTPTTLLATSASITTTTLSTSDAWVYFEFDGAFTLANGTPYFIVLETTTVDIANYVRVNVTISTSHHPGNNATYASGAWGAFSGDLIFEVWSGGSVSPYNDPALTDGQVTTNRMTGTGSFSPGKVSETGLVTDLGFPGNNFTELLYPVQISQAAFANGDAIRFRVLRNGAAITTTQTPLINVVSSFIPPKTGTATVSHDWAVTAAGVAPATANAKLETLTDTFDSEVDKTVKWPSTSVAVVWEAGQAKIPVTTSYWSLLTNLSAGTAYDLTGSGLFAKLTLPPLGNGGRQTAMSVFKHGAAPENDKLRMMVTGSTLTFLKVVGGTQTDVLSGAYNPTTMAWWRIREAGGTIYADTSPDSFTWTNFATTTVSWAITEVSAGFLSGYFGTETASDAYVDNVNTVGAPSGLTKTHFLPATQGTTGTTVDVTGCAWAAGDRLIVFNWGAAGAITPTAPTNANLTFVAVPGATSTSVGGNCVIFTWEATAASAQTGQTITFTKSGTGAFGGIVNVVTGAGGMANLTWNRDEAVTSRTVSAGSIVLYAAADWIINGNRAMVAGSGTATERVDVAVTSQYAPYAGDWVGVTAGTYNFGLADYTNGTFTQAIIEMTSGPGGADSALVITDGRDTMVASGQHTAPLFTTTLVLTDGRDTFVAPATWTTASPSTGERFIESIVARVLEDGTTRHLESYTDVVLPIPATGLVGWWDADDASTFTYSSGVAVSQWSDKSGSNRHFTQSNGALQPWRSGTQNGRTSLIFDADDHMDTAPFTVSQPFTIFLALDARPTSLQGWFGSVGGDIQIYVADPTLNMYAATGNLVGLGLTAAFAGPHYWTFSFNGTSSVGRKDGVQLVTGDAGVAGTTTGWRTAERSLYGNYRLNCPVFEIITYDRVLTGPETAEVESYLNTKWLPTASISSTLAVTDGNDTLAAAGVPTAPTFTATLAQTDGKDTLAAAGVPTAPTFTATLAQTDGRDTLAATGVPTVPTFTATLIVTDGKDTFAGVPTFGPTATFAVTDGLDTIVASGQHTAPTFTSTFAQTDGRDSLIGISAFGPTSTLVVTDGTDTIVALGNTGTPTFTSTLSVTDGLDTIVAAGNTTAPTFTATLAVTDGLDTLAAAGQPTAPIFTATLTQTDGKDTFTAAPTFGPTATLALTDGRDTIVTAVLHTAPTFTSTLVQTDGKDIISSAATAAIPPVPGEALWPWSTVPTDTEVEADLAPILIGTRFTVDAEATVNAIRYYRPPFYDSGVTLELRIHKEP